jgi:hypothetical protein
VNPSSGSRRPVNAGTIGDWTWEGPGWCALPGQIIWAIHEIHAERGTITVLEESQVAFPEGCGAEAYPCSEPLDFPGTFIVQSGTGGYRGARGVWKLVSRQRGNGTTAGVLCGWLDYEGRGP